MNSKSWWRFAALSAVLLAGCSSARAEQPDAGTNYRQITSTLWAVDDTARGVTCYFGNPYNAVSCVKVKP